MTSTTTQPVYMSGKYQREVADFVSREVELCVTGVVMRLAYLMDNAATELSFAVPDFEETAIQDGWKLVVIIAPGGMVAGQRWTKKGEAATYATADELVEVECLDWIENEVFEFWAVSDRLAIELQAQGEKVDTDFHGLNVWARTSTGQAISMDAVICTICDKIVSR